MPRHRFAQMCFDYVRGNVFEVWETEKQKQQWAGEQKVAVGEYVAALVARIDAMCPEDLST